MQIKSFSELSQKIAFEQAVTLVFSKPASPSNEWQKIRFTKMGSAWQISRFTTTQVFHEQKEGSLSSLLSAYTEAFKQLYIAYADGSTAHLLRNKKGTYHYNRSKQNPPMPKNSTPCLKPEGNQETENTRTRCSEGRYQGQATALESHNRTKNYLLPEGLIVPPLIDMGVMDAEGNVFPSKYDKFKQINRFLELIDDVFRKDGAKWSPEKDLHIIDFGCGKAYLTFVVYFYFTQIRRLPVKITGLDLKKEVISHCNEAAQKYGYQNLRFAVGDINGYQPESPVDMVITLHACDTATDYALYNAVSWNADYIFSVPCCQHELNKQIHSDDLPLFTRYGIIQERMSALLTDAIRANLLSAHGYQTQVVEFIDLAHTPKNVMLRAVKQKLAPKQQSKRRALYLQEVESCLTCFHLRPMLYRLLEEKSEG